MALSVLPSISPDWEFPVDNNPKVRRAEFGDSYSQRAGDGINNKRISLSLRWSNLSSDDKDTLIDFFDGLEGVTAFNYTVFSESTVRIFTCPRWTWVPHTSAAFTVLASFIEEFDLAS